jgi:hypothetical protein
MVICIETLFKRLLLFLDYCLMKYMLLSFLTCFANPLCTCAIISIATVSWGMTLSF